MLDTAALGQLHPAQSHRMPATLLKHLQRAWRWWARQPQLLSLDPRMAGSQSKAQEWPRQEGAVEADKWQQQQQQPEAGSPMRQAAQCAIAIRARQLGAGRG